MEATAWVIIIGAVLLIIGAIWVAYMVYNAPFIDDHYDDLSASVEKAEAAAPRLQSCIDYKKIAAWLGEEYEVRLSGLDGSPYITEVHAVLGFSEPELCVEIMHKLRRVNEGALYRALDGWIYNDESTLLEAVVRAALSSIKEGR